MPPTMRCEGIQPFLTLLLGQGRDNQTERAADHAAKSEGTTIHQPCFAAPHQR